MQKAPGKAWRKGMTLMDAVRMFPDDETAEAWFVAKRWPSGPHCPHCGSTNVLSGAKHATMPYRCREKACRKRFSVRTGTAMDSSNVGYQKWALRALPVRDQPEGRQLHETSPRSRRDTEDRVVHGAPHPRGMVRPGPRVRRPRRGRRDLYRRSPQEHVEREAQGGSRAPGGALWARPPSSAPRTAPPTACPPDTVADTGATTLQGFVVAHATPDAKVYTDEGSAYTGMPRDHAAVNHSARGVRPRPRPHKRDRVVLVDAETRLPRHLPPHVSQALGPVRCRVRPGGTTIGRSIRSTSSARWSKASTGACCAIGIWSAKPHVAALTPLHSYQ